MPRGGWELIVVDNGSTDDTGDVVDSFSQSADFDVMHLREPRPGSGWAKNAGLARARGRIAAFTDDDCYVRPDFLQQISRIFEEGSLGYLGGRIELYDPEDAVQAIRTDEVPIWIEPYSFVRPGFIMGANMAALRDVCDALGGFDPRFGAGATFTGEDNDFAARASWAGWRGKYDPRPVVAHHHGRKPGHQAASRMREYEFSRGAYYAKFMLNRRARATYLRHWYASVRDLRWRGNRLSIARELFGAARYVISELAGGEAPPRSSVA